MAAPMQLFVRKSGTFIYTFSSATNRPSTESEYGITQMNGLTGVTLVSPSARDVTVFFKSKVLVRRSVT
jgi:hypothetical protein